LLYAEYTSDDVPSVCIAPDNWQIYTNNKLLALQLMGPAGIADLVTAQSDTEDWLWKTVRKGVAPAFAPQALRSDLLLLTVAVVAFVPQASDCLSFAHQEWVSILAFQQLRVNASTVDCRMYLQISGLVFCRQDASCILKLASLCGQLCHAMLLRSIL